MTGDRGAHGEVSQDVDTVRAVGARREWQEAGLDGGRRVWRAGRESMNAILNTLLPVFLIIGLGAILQAGGFFAEGMVAALNRLVFWVALPVLLFTSLVTAEHNQSRPVALLGVLVGVTLAVCVLGWVWARVLKVAGPAQGTFVQAGFRGNLAFVGLPILLSLPGVDKTAAVLVLAPMMVLYNVLAVLVLLVSRDGLAALEARGLLVEMARNPLILANLAGAGVYALGWRLSGPTETTLTMLSRMSVPLALLCIGAAVASLPVRGSLRLALATAVLKTGAAPVLGWIAARAAGLGAEETRMAMLLLACPTAAAAYTMVCQMGGDESLAASSVVLSMVLSAVSLALIVGLS